MALCKGTNVPTALLLALILLQTVFCCICASCDGPEIHDPPADSTVLINSDAAFSCVANGTESEVSWSINSRYLDNDRMKDLMNQGYDFQATYEQCITMLNMTVRASAEKNNTEIECCVSDVTSECSTAYLVVIGPPLPPDPVLNVVNVTTLRVSWMQPYSWPGYNILNYKIEIENQSTGEKIHDAEYVNRTQHTFHFFSDMVAESCMELTIYLSAINAAGESEAAEISGGFPIAPGPTFTSSIKAEVYFKSDGTPVANVTFELPHMCTYQTLEYTIVICNLTTEAKPCFDVGPKEYLYSLGSSVSEVLESQLVSNALYSITAVTVQTAAGNSTSNDSAIFNTLNQTTTDQRLTVIVAAAVGSTSAAVLLLVAAGIAIAKAVVRTRKHEQGDHTQSVNVAQSAMVPNPIYEGPMYETIVPQNFDALAANVESETLELRYLANPILPARSGGETNAVIAPVTDNASATPRSDDNYTVMSPIGSHSISSLMNKADQDAETQ